MVNTWQNKESIVRSSGQAALSRVFCSSRVLPSLLAMAPQANGIVTRARKAAQIREHAEKAAACQDSKTAIRQFKKAERKCRPSETFLTVFGVSKFAKEMMRKFYLNARYEVMLFESKKRGYVTFCFGQISSVIKTFDTMDEALASVGSVLNEALYEMMANGDAMYRRPGKAVLWYPMEGGEEETFYRAEVPVHLDTPATLLRSDLVPYTPGPVDGSEQISH